MKSVACLFALGVGAMSCARAQEQNWDNLKALRQGQQVQVVDNNMKSWTGKFAGFTDDAISLGLDKGFFRRGDKTIARSSVYRVSRVSRARGTLLGLAIGAAVGGGLSAYGVHRIDEGYGGAITKGGLVALMMVACAGAGAAIGSAFPSHPTVYRATPEATPKAGGIDPATYLYAANRR